MKFTILTLMSALFFHCGLGAQDQLDQELAALREANPSQVAASVSRVVATGATPKEIVRRLRMGVLPAPSSDLKSGWSLVRSRDAHGREVMYQLYLAPSVLNAEEPLTLLVHLHGSVARESYSTELGDVGYGRRLWVPAAEEHGFVLACPLGKKGAEWWTDQGVAAVEATIRDVKRRLPVHDDRVIGTGFSDGASGLFHLAMTGSSVFAAQVPMNGHPTVPARISGRRLDPRNLAATPMMVFSTLDDSLYPSSSVLPHFIPALAARGALRLISWEKGDHRPAYFSEMGQVITNYVLAARRDRFPARRDWTFDRPGRHGEVEAIAFLSEDIAAPQVLSTPGRIRMGVTLSTQEGADFGVVESVAKNGVAAAMGIEPQDRLLQIAGLPIENRFSFFTSLAGKRHGDTLQALVDRKGERKTLRGVIPAFVPKPIYRRDGPMGRVEMRGDAATMNLKTKGLRRLKLHWRQAGTLPKSVIWNDKTVALQWTAVSIQQILTDYAGHGDGAQISTHWAELVRTK